MNASHGSRGFDPDPESGPLTETTEVKGNGTTRERTGFIRSIGLLQATAINMTQMCGIGPFITIPVMVAAFGGPQAILGWIAGAILALADGQNLARRCPVLAEPTSICARHSSTVLGG